MPELPEVETYARDLATVLPGRRIEGVMVDWPNQLPLNDPEEVGPRLAGQTFEAVSRRGKYIVIRLSTDWLIVHLKMSGRLQIAEADAEPNPYAHVVFKLDRGEELRFHDPRKFGRVYALDDPAPVLGALGPEPLDPGLSPERFRDMLGRRRGRMKPLLLNQSFVAGLGNIYTDEALWQARIHPLRTADSLTEAEMDALLEAIRDVLEAGIAARGTTFSTAGYRDLEGRRGEMTRQLAVFRRTGEPCPRCRKPIVRTVVGQRGTHYCPTCQRQSP